MSDPAEIAWRIKRLRKDRGWTQYELASEIGAKRYCITRWETGVAMPSLPALYRLADVFGCRIDWLARGVS